jgi:hypothetical protein
MNSEGGWKPDEIQASGLRSTAVIALADGRQVTVPHVNLEIVSAL